MNPPGRHCQSWATSAIWSEWQGWGQTGRAGNIDRSLTELGSQLQEPIYLSSFANMEAVMYAEVIFIGQIHDNNTVKLLIKILKGF